MSGPTARLRLVACFGIALSLTLPALTPPSTVVASLFGNLPSEAAAGSFRNPRKGMTSSSFCQYDGAAGPGSFGNSEDRTVESSFGNFASDAIATAEVSGTSFGNSGQETIGGLACRSGGTPPGKARGRKRFIRQFHLASAGIVCVRLEPCDSS